MSSEPKRYDRDDINWSDKLEPGEKERLFQLMPHIMVKNDDGTRMEWRCINNVWTWKHINDDGLVLAEGEGAP
jgi:hypothetical protein